MTDKRDLKKRVRARQARTGERYITALAQVKSRGRRSTIEISENHDASNWAAMEGFRCQISVSETLWQAECSVGAPAERFRAIFVRLRAFLEALRGEPGAELLSKTILLGEPWSGETPNAIRETAEGTAFIAQVRAGMRSVSRNARLLALDVPRGESQVTLLGVCLAVRGRTPLLMLRQLVEASSPLAQKLRDDLGRQLLLSGIGGLADRDGR